MKFSYAIFDMDGLMFDTENLFVRAFEEAIGGIGCTVQGSAEGLGLLALGLADDPVDHLVVRVVGHPHTHLDAGKDIGAQVLNDVLQPVVTAGGAAFADTQLAHRQGHVVGDDQHMVGGYLVKPRGLAHGLTGKVHIGLGLHHQYFMPLIVQHTGPCLKAELIQSEFLLFHQAVLVDGVRRDGSGAAPSVNGNFNMSACKRDSA